MTRPLSELYGLQVKPEDKVVIDYWLIHPGESVYVACKQGYPNITKRGAPQKFRYMVKRPESKSYIDAKRCEMNAKVDITMEQALIEMEAISHCDIYDYLDVVDGVYIIKSKEELNALQRRCVKEIKVKNIPTKQEDGSIEYGSEVTLKLWDKQKAQNDLARIFGWGVKIEEDLPPGVRHLINIGVLMLPPNQTPEEAIKTYLPYDGNVIEAEK